MNVIEKRNSQICYYRLRRVEDHTARIESNTSEIKEDVSKLVYRLNGIGSNVVKHLSPDFQESIDSLKVNNSK